MLLALVDVSFVATQWPMSASIKRAMIGEIYLFTTRPVFRSRPERVSGTPIFREILPFAADAPMARRHENDAPYVRRFAILLLLLLLLVD